MFAPSPSPTPYVPVYYGAPAARMKLNARPLGFDVDGNARWLVVSEFFDAHGKRTRIIANSDFDWLSRDGYVQWQTRLRFGQPSAILKTQRDGPLTMTVRANMPKLAGVTVQTDTRTWTQPRVVAEALGPHMVQIGWFPQEERLTRVVRIDRLGHRATIAIISGPSSTLRDTDVTPSERYRYVVYRADHPAVTVGPVLVPGELPSTSVANASGKAMWFYFTTNPVDPIYFKHIDPRAVVDQAVRAGLHYVELRTAYGAYWEITPEAKPTIDAIIDGLAAHGIGTIGWTVPRDTTFEDLQQSVRTAYYRTSRGTPLSGLAIDVERGDDFMGNAPQGPSALWQYVQYARQALGPRYLIVTTVEDPYLEHLSRLQYPYEQIARFSDVLQPMTYWRMLGNRLESADQIEGILRSSYANLLHEAGRTIPVSFGGQTNAIGPSGSPPAREITASLRASKAAGAIGECFFAWDGTQPDQWNALGAFRW